MNPQIRVARRAVVVASLVLWALAGLSIASSCAKAPPTLSPVGVRAFHATRAVAVLDVVRDTAIAAEAARPQLISTASAREVVLWHRTAVAVAGAVPTGWQATVSASLGALERILDPPEREVLRPYLALVRAVLEVR